MSGFGESIRLDWIGLDQSVPRDRSTLNPINQSIDRSHPLKPVPDRLHQSKHDGRTWEYTVETICVVSSSSSSTFMPSTDETMRST